MSARRKLSRRQFVKEAAATAAFMIVPSYVLGGRGNRTPSETVTRAVIGTGGMGMSHVVENGKDGPPVTLAVCDVDANHLANGLRKAGRGCDGYSDFRRVLERKDIDTVHVPTPPHWHTLVNIAAMEAGKDVYSEKPLTRFIHEGKVLVETVKRTGRMFQINSYGRADFHRLRRLVASGLLGTPLTARVYKRFDYNWKVAMWSGKTDLVPEPVPSVLDYDMWLGPAPFKPYHPHRVHQSFRGYWDYDGGGLADMGQHWLDPIQYILGKDGTGPADVWADAPFPQHPDAVGLWGHVYMRYTDGTRIIMESEEWGEKEAGNPPFLEGPKGKVFDRYSDRTDPPGLFERSASVPVPPRDRGFEDAVRTRDNSNSAKPNAEEGHRSSTLFHLANIAIRMGRRIKWDPKAEKIIGDPGANALVNVPMRAPWHL